ncbi:DUF2130 domain-containing protein [Patescibacteria group bacterium]|nr:DUF2130 domain-containing protein [Patescibacteria group bacterium]MBU1721817.1 DUF2130 domain-containing protein [Patescibacteria group bacterium]MBU1901688.1 DUF2130 domain-containing protein [Patescibacteria group bacterium]
MSDQHIICPSCSSSIPLSEALTKQISTQLEIELRKDIDKQLAEVQYQKQALQKQSQEIEQSVQEKLQKEKEKMWVLAQEKAQEKIGLELQDLQKINQEKEEKIRNMQVQELELRKQKREIEEKEKSLKFELQRQLDEEREKISKQVKEEASEESRLKIAEKDKQMEQMRSTIEDLKRKSEQGSMQIQGDVQENDLKMLLQQHFPMDGIEDVPTGVRGADLVQHVEASFGQHLGVILWESKNTKVWSNNWIKKLKDDQAVIKADVCILVSQSLPADVETFAFKDGVWVCHYKFALALVATVRLHLRELNQAKQSLVGKDQKMEYVYDYLRGNEFRNKIENIVSAFASMKEGLETEKRSMQRIWSKREKEIERVIMNTSGMYGDLQGIMGVSLPTVDALELPGEDDEEIDEGQGKLLN